MKVMIMAAGVGSRLILLTSHLPKPMVPIANRPVMEHIVDLLKRHHVRDIIANLHYIPGKFQNHFGSGDSLSNARLWPQSWITTHSAVAE